MLQEPLGGDANNEDDRKISPILILIKMSASKVKLDSYSSRAGITVRRCLDLLLPCGHEARLEEHSTTAALSNCYDRNLLRLHGREEVACPPQSSVICGGFVQTGASGQTSTAHGRPSPKTPVSHRALLSEMIKQC
jgi:hypothetical protein